MLQKSANIWTGGRFRGDTKIDAAMKFWFFVISQGLKVQNNPNWPLWQIVICGDIEGNPGPTDCTEKKWCGSTSEIRIPNYDQDFVSECILMDEYPGYSMPIDYDYNVFGDFCPIAVTGIQNNVIPNENDF